MREQKQIRWFHFDAADSSRRVYVPRFGFDIESLIYVGFVIAMPNNTPDLTAVTAGWSATRLTRHGRR